MAPDPRKNDEVKSGVERKGNRGKGKFSSDAQASGKGQQVRSELNLKVGKFRRVLMNVVNFKMVPHT